MSAQKSVAMGILLLHFTHVPQQWPYSSIIYGFGSQLLHIHSLCRVCGQAEAKVTQQAGSGNLSGVKDVSTRLNSVSHLSSPSCASLALGPIPSPTSHSNDEARKVLLQSVCSWIQGKPKLVPEMYSSHPSFRKVSLPFLE